ncbi:MAG: hypothetical protein ACI4KD_07550 [Oscillospiraceae bacterium]
MSNTNGSCNCNNAVCVEAQRIYDSCCDKECISDLVVTLDNNVCYVDSKFTLAKTKSVKVSNVCICVESVPFDKGFYSVDITYTFSLVIDLFEGPCTIPTTVTGTAVFSKKVILFGGTGNTKTFCSEGCNVLSDCENNCDLPKACVQIVDPIALNTKLVPLCCGPWTMPPAKQDEDIIHRCCCGNNSSSVGKCINVSIGLFSIIKLTRQVAMLIPVLDFCMPKKPCCGDTINQNASDTFDKIDFPTDEFFPPALDCNECTTCDCINDVD